MVEGIELGPLGQIARSVRDTAESERWYRSVLGLPHLYTFGQLAFFDCGGVRLMLSGLDEVQKADSVLYFRVGDIEAAYRDLARRGVRFLQPPHMIHRYADGVEEWMAFFEDNEGGPLALMAQKMSGA